jgi:hypothetical protein
MGAYSGSWAVSDDRCSNVSLSMFFHPVLTWLIFWWLTEGRDELWRLHFKRKRARLYHRSFAGSRGWIRMIRSRGHYPYQGMGKQMFLGYILQDK